MNEDEIKKENIQDRVLVIAFASKVVNKYHHLETVQEIIDVMHHQIKGYIELFNPLFKRGLPFFWEEKGGTWSQKEYNDMLFNYKSDQRQFDDMQN